MIEYVEATGFHNYAKKKQKSFFKMPPTTLGHPSKQFYGPK